LHPSWQEKVRDILRYLADDTGNQIVVATHSPGFVSEDTIANVSRVYVRNGQTAIQELNSVDLPDRSKLFRMVKLQNNAKLFFAKNVLLVEGPSDELVVRRLVRELGIYPDDLEIISVGGKGMFASYTALLTALGVPHAILADRDYPNEVGSERVRKMFKVDGKAVRDKVLTDPLSTDGDRVVRLISEAIETGDFADAKDTWAYILGRRLQLKTEPQRCGQGPARRRGR
jgi:predicted ATP-dependent endonuclease of OLD family